MTVPDPIRVVLLPADTTGCGMYRMILPGIINRDAGNDIVINYPMDRRNWKVDLTVTNGGDPSLPLRNRPVEGASVSEPVDLVMFQRPNSRRLFDTIGFLQDQGVAVAVDLDDALWSVHPGNSSARSWNADSDHNWRWAMRCARRADVFIATTQALVDKVGRGVVIPNYLPASIIAKRAKSHPGNDTIIIGWAGIVETHPGDPQTIGGMVREVVVSTNGRFNAIGGGLAELRAFGFGDEDRKHDNNYAYATGPIPFEHWHRSLRTLDISIVPLADTVFNRGKSALKMLESAAQGCTAVVSPTPDNLRIATDYGYGLTASSPQQWARHMLRLAKDERLFSEQSEAGIATARSNTYEEHAWRWMEVWESAVISRRRATRSVTA